MSHRHAKYIRQQILPGRALTGTGRGNLIRSLTAYERKVHKRVLVAWPLQELYGPIEVDYYTQTLHPKCPLAIVKKVKKYARQARANLSRA